MPEDLPEGFGVEVYKEDGLTYFIYTKDGNKQWDGASANKRSGNPSGYVAITLGKDQNYGNCLDGYYVKGSSTTSGWGPMLYDLAMEWATHHGGGLTADRSSVSKAAHAVWKYYDENRTDIESAQLDIIAGTYGQAQLTPDDPNDDCGQHASIVWTDYNKGEWHDAPTSRIFRSKGNPTMEKLLNLDKLKVQNNIMKLIMESWRKYLKEAELLSEMFVKGHEDGNNIVAYRENLWKLRDDVDEEDPVRDEISQALKMDDAWIDVHELRDLLEDSPDVLIGEYDGGSYSELYIHRGGSFQLDPKSSILVKKVVKALGANGASYAPMGGDGDPEFVGSYQLKGKVADTMYHGTTSNYLTGLMKFGLVPGEKETNYEGIEHPNAVFFSSRFDEAQHHATHTASKVGGDPVVLELKVPDPALLIPDYDVDMGAGDTGCYDYICKTIRDKSSQSLDADSFSLSREVGIYGYKGRVPAVNISSYYILMNAEMEMGDDMHYAGKEQYTEATPEEAAVYVDTKNEYGHGSLEYPDWDDEDEDW